VEGSKSSLAKGERRLAQQLAKQKRHDRIREWFPVELAGEEGRDGPQVPLSEAETGFGEELGVDGFDSDSEEDPWAFEPSFGLAPAPLAASLSTGPSQSMNNSAQRETPPPDSSPRQQSHEEFQEPQPQVTRGTLKTNASFSINEATWSAERKNVGFISSGDYPPAAAVASSVAFSLGPNHCDSISSLFGAWIRTVEATVASHHGQASLGRSRAEGPKFRTDTVLEATRP